VENGEGTNATEEPASAEQPIAEVEQSGSLEAEQEEAPAPEVTKPPDIEAVQAPQPPTQASALPDLNAMTFEDLRELGLSVTQTKRLLAQREQRGGFKSLDELDAVPGFPRDVLEDLRRATSLGA
jgi:competence protein ComEA